jgi:hypothetical protein
MEFKEIEKIASLIKEKEQIKEKIEKPIDKKEILKEVLEEKINESLPFKKERVIEKKEDFKKEDIYEEKINELVDLALEKGITQALKKARQMKNPYLIDKLHDKLAEKYYQVLKDRKLI